MRQFLICCVVGLSLLVGGLGATPASAYHHHGWHHGYGWHHDRYHCWWSHGHRHCRWGYGY
jgi:hypothetical protein